MADDPGNTFTDDFADLLDELRRRRGAGNAPEPEDDPTDDPLGFDVGEAILNDPPPARKWLLASTVLTGCYTMLTAAGATGKTSVVLAWAVGAALGRSDIAGTEVFGRYRVLVLCGEDNAREWQRRVWALLIHWGVDPNDVRGWLRVIPTAHSKVSFATERDRRLVTSDRGFTALERMLDRYEPDIVIFDPLMAFVPVGLNDNGCMVAVANRLNDLLEARDFAAVIAHHPSKAAMRSGGTGDADAGLGAIMLVNNSRISLALNKVDPKVSRVTIGVLPGEAWRHAYLTGPKVNVAPQFSDRHFRLESVTLPNAPLGSLAGGDDMQAAVPFTPRPGAADIDHATMQTALAVLATGKATPHGQAAYSPHHQTKGGRYYVLDVAAALATINVNASTAVLNALAKDVYAQADRDDWLEVQQLRVPGPSGNTNDGIVVKWSNTPWGASTPSPGPYGV